MDSAGSLVVYDSWTGNTKLVAESIAKGMNTSAVSIKDNPPLTSGLLVVGSPTHFVFVSPKLKQYIEESKPESMAVFTTYGAPGKFGDWTSNKTLEILHKPDVKLVGSFKAKGFHPILRTFKGHPDEGEIMSAEEFGKRVRGNQMSYGAESPNMWINQNLPFFCGLKQGLTNGMHPDLYQKDPDNFCSSPKWYNRGYNIGQTVKQPNVFIPLILIMAILFLVK